MFVLVRLTLVTNKVSNLEYCAAVHLVIFRANRETMNALTANIGRHFRALYKRKSRPTRLTELGEQRQEIHDGKIESVHPSSRSTASNEDVESPVGLLRAECVETQPLNTVEPVSTDDDEDDRFEDADECPERLQEAESEPFPVPSLNDLEIVGEDEPKDDPYAEEQVLDDQAIRDQAYIYIQPEQPEDYTVGPARMVISNDGVEECPALLMTYELSTRIQRASRAQRDFARSEQDALRQREVLSNFEIDLEHQIASHSTKLAIFEEESPSEEQKALEEELEILELMLNNAKDRRQAVKANLETKANMLLEMQASAIAILEDAFIQARLLEPEIDEPDTPIEELDLENEYQDFRRTLEQSDEENEVEPEPLHTGNEHLQHFDPAIAEWEHEQEKKQEYLAARKRLQEAQSAFDRRDGDSDMQRQANYEAVEHSMEAADATPEDFDMRWLKRTQELTRELIDAEVAVAEAKADAIRLGADIAEQDQESGFVSNFEDGYRTSFEQEQIASVPLPKVENWLSSVPEATSPSFNDREEDGDEWEADDVEISDSVSLVAEGAERRRIDKWRQVCGL